MVVIRGATTIPEDTSDEIKRAVEELLEQIVSCNHLIKDEIVSIVFSSTSDIHSYYPAKAAREAGYMSCSLFSAMEPDIDGGLPLCIRVMIFVETNIMPRHIYLRGAKVLRKDLTRIFNVAIDGPAGSGKSTVAKLLAKDYNILHLDTGAMYRACALKVLEAGVDVEDETAIVDLMRDTTIDVEFKDGMQVTLLDGEDVSEKIRLPHVSMAASSVSKHPSVRMHLAEKQRQIAHKMSCVLDGRDIGTFVLPDADFKFYLTATPEVRARRRFEELKKKGIEVDFEKLKEEIVARDEQDMGRKIAPLKLAEDATLVDTSDMTIEEVVSFLKNKMQEKI